MRERHITAFYQVHTALTVFGSLGGAHSPSPPPGVCPLYIKRRAEQNLMKFSERAGENVLKQISRGVGDTLHSNGETC